MKIFFISNYSQLYGANRSLLSIVEKCKKCGDEVYLLLPTKGDLSEELKRKGIKYKVIPFVSSLFYYRKLLPYIALPLLDLWTFCILPYILYITKKFKPDLIYSNSSAENIGIILARVMKIKHVTHVREFMDLDYRCKFLFGRKAKKWYICKSDGVLYVSKSVARHILMDEKMPINHKVIYNGIRSTKDKFTEKTIPDNINLGIVGFLDEGKGQDMAIRYFYKITTIYPKSKLHIWGDKEGEYKSKLIKIIEELKLEGKVIMHGFEKNSNVIYSDMHVLLMCSKAEGFGRVTVEAMMRGIPVLGYNSGGTAEIIKHGFTGYVFSTEKEFIKNIQEMFISDEHYNKLCLNAFNYSHEYFSEDNYTDNVKTFINNLK